jgi:acetylglutamate kinase
MSDVPGLMRNPKDPTTVIPHLRINEVPALKQAGIVDQGMIPKVDSAVAAIRAGVEKVSFVDGRVPHAVLLEIFTDEGVGTEVVR